MPIAPPPPSALPPSLIRARRALACLVVVWVFAPWVWILGRVEALHVHVANDALQHIGEVEALQRLIWWAMGLTVFGVLYGVRQLHRQVDRRLIGQHEALVVARRASALEAEGRRKAERLTVVALEQERALNAARDRFVRSASQLFQTPLAAAQVAADEVAEGAEQPGHRVLGQSIRRQVEGLQSLIGDLVVVDRAARGALEVSTRSQDLIVFAEEVLVDLRLAWPDADRVVLVPPARPLFAEIDAALLGQSLLHLLANALRYAPSDTRVVIQMESRAGQAVIRVIDEGPGLPGLDLPRLFDPLYRGDTAEGTEGAGLGLAFARSVAEAHQGTLEATEVDRPGATFTLVLPLDPLSAILSSPPREAIRRPDTPAPPTLLDDRVRRDV